jgi:hypothetical protein
MLTCGNCGMEKFELQKPTPRHSRVAFCTTCGAFTTYLTFKHAPEFDGWTRNPTPPQWAKDAVKDLEVEA